IWLSTDGQGLYRPRTAQTIRVFSKKEGLPDRNVYPIHSGRDGSVWIGTWSGGLCRFRRASSLPNNTADGLANPVNAIFEDSDGALWVAVQNGLHRLRNGRFESTGTVLCGVCRGMLPDQPAPLAQKAADEAYIAVQFLQRDYAAFPGVIQEKRQKAPVAFD